MQSFPVLKELFNSGKIILSNEIICKILSQYTFLTISSPIDFDHNSVIYNNFKESSFIIVKGSGYQDQNDKKQYLIINFQKTILIIEPIILQESKILNNLLSTKSELNICFISDEKNHFDQFTYNELPIPSDLQDINLQLEQELSILRIKNFYSNESKAYKNVIQIWDMIKPCISSYLIQRVYFKLKKNRILNFCEQKENHEIEKIEKIQRNEIIKLKTISIGSSFQADLVYHIEKEELFVIKIPIERNSEKRKLMTREFENYKKVKHPLIPYFCGLLASDDFIIIEYIHGHSLQQISELNLNINEKISIIFELMIIIEFLHRNNFVFRDLKPNNVIIDENKIAVLIDFDNMINIDDAKNRVQFTNDFASSFVDSEINSGNVSFGNDIYSLGIIIYYILTEKNINDLELINYDELKMYPRFQEIIQKCTTKLEERPSINNLLYQFYKLYCNYIQVDIFYKTNNNNILPNCVLKAQFDVGLNYFGNKDFDSTIYFMKLAADQNYIPAINFLGIIYYDYHYSIYDINKSIYYFELSAKQNDLEGLEMLGIIYMEIKHDINKAIYYLETAAKQNHSDSLYNLGVIYNEDKYNNKNIDKAIHYFTLAANLNHPVAQYNLSVIYSSKTCNRFDINKAIFYLNLSSNNNFSLAQYKLGYIYEKGEYVKQDINKAMNLYVLAAQDNNVDAQLHLGALYLNGNHVAKNIDKALYYFKLTENRCKEADYNIGIAYFKKKDINKAIFYLTKAANQNYVIAQKLLGEIYSSGDYIKCDIEKALYYYSLAAKQNDIESIAKLGLIHYECNNSREAIHYFSIAAAHNDQTAQFILGYLYLFGYLVNQDINKGINYLISASNLNDSYAQALLGYAFSHEEYMIQDINKSIHYYTLAANQNLLFAQFNLGFLYHKLGENDKAIHYLTLSANRNMLESFLLLSVIYFDKKDVSKTIHYLQKASDLNNCYAQLILGLLYYEGHFVTSDINKSIYYLSLAANQNNVDAILKLSYIYKYIKKDMNKAFKYLTQAANQNNSIAQFLIGIAYLEGKYVPRDINKVISYLMISSQNKFFLANLFLGYIYSFGIFVPKNIAMGIHYMSISANQKEPISLVCIGLLYLEGANLEGVNLEGVNLEGVNLEGVNFQKDVNKGINFILQSAEKRNKLANFLIGFFRHFGKYMKKDINESIKYYKEASSYNFKPAKLNLGIIYGYEIENKTGYNHAIAIRYFEEVIQQNNDSVAMYNLAHLYAYKDSSKDKYDKSIELLIKSTNLGFAPSKELLCLVLIRKNGLDYNCIHKDINSQSGLEIGLLKMIKENHFDINLIFEKQYLKYSEIIFVYDKSIKPIPILSLKNQQKSTNLVDIDSRFYEGFGFDFLNPK